MIANTAIFTCSICGESSSNICAYCTKDACSNHRCERCKRCSDCCECEFPLSAEEPAPPEVEIPAEAALASHAALAPETATGFALAPDAEATVVSTTEPLVSETPAVIEATAIAALAPETQAATGTLIEAAHAVEIQAAAAGSSVADFLTPAEASVFAAETVPSEPALPQATGVFIEETDTIKETGTIEETDSENIGSVTAPEPDVPPDATNLHEPSEPENHSPSA